MQHFELHNLKRYTEYVIIVQPFNSRGAGPPSEEVEVRTMEFGKYLFLTYLCKLHALKCDIRYIMHLFFVS